MDQFDRIIEQFKVHSQDLANKIRELIHEGNVRRIIIKDEKGDTFMELPLTYGVVGAFLMPALVAVGAVAALASNFTIEVVRREDAGSQPPQK